MIYSLLPSANGLSFTFMLSQFSYSFYLPQANTSVNLVTTFVICYILDLLYCFVLTNIHEIYMLKVESNC